MKIFSQHLTVLFELVNKDITSSISTL